VGFAGTTLLNNTNGGGSAYYGKAAIFVGRDLGKERALVFGLDYNGNRSTFPDIPIPGFAYTTRLDPTLLANFGFPYTSVLWEPVEHLKVDAAFSFPDTLDARVSYDLSQQWRLYGNFENRLKAFHVEGLGHDRRLFFQQRRLEAGVRWQPRPFIGVVAAGGYAFSQEFSVGFDTRDLGNITHLSDEPYVRVGVEIRP
jgi:hypothetical protein